MAAPAPDLMGALAQASPLLSSGVIVALISFVASLICAVTPTPAPGSRWRGLYELIECIALITRTSKETGIPTVDALHTASLALASLPREAPPLVPPAAAAAEPNKEKP